MAYYIPGQQTDVFGGPAGGTFNAMMQMMQGYLMGEQKREEEKQMRLLAEIFGKQEGQEPITRENVIERILQNPDLKPRARMMGIRAADVLPVRETPDYTILEYWDKDGTPRKKRILESKYNQRVAEIEAQGGSFKEPNKYATWGKPVRYGNTWVQKNNLTGKYEKAYSDKEGWSQPYESKKGNIIQRNLATNEIKVVEKTADVSQKRLDSLRSDFRQEIGRYYSAKRGVGQFIPDENKEQIAQEAYTSAMKIAEQYVKEGGSWADLGLNEAGKEKPQQEMAEMPPAGEHKDRIIKDTKTGKRYKSDGKNWIEIE